MTWTIEPLEHRQLLSAGYLGHAPATDEPGQSRADLSPLAAHAPSKPAPQTTRADTTPTGKSLRGSDSGRLVDIFGKDSRRHVHNSRKYPYSAVGRLETTWDDSGIVSYCSGAMISAYHFLTAAHCVYNSEYGGWADGATVLPAKNGKNEPYGSADYSYIRIDDRYEDGEETEYDYALITLDERIGDDTSWFGYESLKAGTFKGLKVENVGYPRDRGGTGMYRQTGRTIRATSREIITKLDAGVGQSGGPVFERDKGNYYIVGVLTSSSTKYTYLTRITSSRFDRLESWMNEDDRVRAPRSFQSRRAAVVSRETAVAKAQTITPLRLRSWFSDRPLNTDESIWAHEPAGVLV